MIESINNRTFIRNSYVAGSQTRSAFATLRFPINRIST